VEGKNLGGGGVVEAEEVRVEEAHWYFEFFIQYWTKNEYYSIFFYFLY
jgi:hypothetical protein